jgi:hypothetical protein
MRRDLGAMAKRGVPIVAGPWLGEVGFELLYWIPFLRWCAEEMNIGPAIVAISRGGTASWYRPFASRYADVFEQVTADAFRDQHDARVRELGEQKQTRITEFDRRLVDTAMRGARLSDWALLHPSRMYELFNPYWWGHRSQEWVHAHTRYATLPWPDCDGVPPMPSRYVAVKFYFNECFPATARNRQFVRETLRALAARCPVVSLTTGLHIDDHDGARIDEDGVRHLPEGIDAARNLHVQSAIVARADAFVGTYGGFSYMAPFYGLPSLAFYSNVNGFSAKHLQMARSAFERIGAPGLLDVQDVANVADVSRVVDRVLAAAVHRSAEREGGPVRRSAEREA